MRKFFVSADLSAGQRILLSREETKHAAKVLRLEPGEKVILLNGRGVEAHGTLLGISAEGAEVEVHEVKKITKAMRLELLQAPLKGPKMDWLVEKLTELGVDALWPSRTLRTVALGAQSTVAAGEKEDRWVRLAQSAMKQSGNATMPEIHPVNSLEETLQKIPATAGKIILLPGANLSLGAAVQKFKADGLSTILLAIGPEGGFTDDEEQVLAHAGFIAACLSKQVLRGETAAIAALSIAAHCIDF